MVWIIDAGVIDLYIAKAREGVPVGAYHHLLRLDEGQALFGIDPVEYGDIALIASPAPGVRLKFDSLRRFREEALSGPPDGELVRLLNGWICKLSAAAHRSIPPKDFTPLSPGERFQTGENAQAILPDASVVWVRQATGISYILANEHRPLQVDSHAYPVTTHTWVEAQANSEIFGFDTFTFLKHDASLSGLGAFHANLLTRILESWRESEERGRRRLKEKEAADSRTLESAIFELSTPISGKSNQSLNLEGIVDTPLMRACQIIGNHLGVAMKPHPDMVSGADKKGSVPAIAKASGVRCRRVVLHGQWWKQGGGPLLVFREPDQDPIPVLPSGPRSYQAHDPVTRTWAPVNLEFLTSLNPVAYSFYRPFPNKPISGKELLAFGLRGCRSELLMVVLMGLAIGGLAVIPPISVGIIFDSLIPSAQRTELAMASALLMVAAIAANLFKLTRGFAVLRLQTKVGNSLQAAMWDKLLSLPVRFFRDFAAGDLAVRSLGVAEMRRTLTGATLDSILSGVFSIFSLALLFYYSSQLAILGLGLSILAFVVTLLCGRGLLAWEREGWAQRSLISGMLLEFISGISKFRVAGAENRAFAIWVREFTKQKSADYSARRINVALATFNSIYLVLCLAVIFWFNAAFLQTGPNTLSTGKFLAFVAAFTQLMSAILGMGAAVVSVMLVIPIYELARPILQALPETNATKTSPGELSGAIEANHVVFRYRPDTPLVLRDISFSIAPGEYVAFVGPSGCGKSTLFRLLLGFETPDSGAIYFDGQDLAGLDAQAVRQKIGVVLQTSALISGSILDNLRGAANASLKDAWEASRMAGLEEDIRRMPMGMYTMINEDGGGLSGGQRQRILIARSIIRKPRILMMDEATSALDNRTQAIVSESLKMLKSTRIVIAHRLSTIIDADRIFVMNKGEIVQFGSYSELMNERGLFRELASRQLA